MNISIESFQKRILNPVWSSNHIHDTTTMANVWPLRPQSHPRRFYSTPKPRRSYFNVTQFSPQLMPISMRVDIEQYNRHKSQSSMAFCSTSKVKYMPIQGTYQSEIIPHKYIAPNSGKLPSISRPSSRPVILHGQRYTVMAVEDEIASTGVSSATKEDTKLSPKIEYVSEQRRRFNEAERQKSNTRIYRETTDASEYRIRRNYCLSGHSIFINRAGHSHEDRINRRMPSSSYQVTTKNNDQIVDGELKIEDAENDGDPPGPMAQVSETDQIPPEEVSNCVISVDIAPGAKAEMKNPSAVSLVADVIIRAKESLAITKADEAATDQAKQLLTGMIESHAEIHEDILISSEVDPGTIEDLWSALQPIRLEYREHSNLIGVYERLVGLDSSEGCDVQTFITKIFGDDVDIPAMRSWSKIFSLLGIRTMELSVFTRIVTLIRLFQKEICDEELFKDGSGAKIFIWLNLLATLLGVQEGMDSYLLNYLQVISRVLVNRNILDDELTKSIQESLLRLTDSLSLTESDDATTYPVPLSQLIETMPWILRTHQEIFDRPLLLDDIAITLALPMERVAM